MVTGTAAARYSAAKRAGDAASGHAGGAERGGRLPRGYRWVARKPASGAGTGRAGASSTARRQRAPSGPTPRYRTIPRWGLPVGPVEEAGGDPGSAREAGRARALLTATMVLFALAAVSEMLRYALLLRGRGHLVHRVTAGLSDAVVLVFGYASMVFVVLSAVACAAWLVRARAAAYREAGEAEPRGERRLYAGVIVPIVNLVYPGVFLAELVRARGRAGREAALAAPPGGAFEPGLGADSRPQPFRTGSVRERLAAVRTGTARRLRRVRAGYRRLRDGTAPVVLVRFWWGLWVLANVTAFGVALQRLDGSLQARADGVLYSLFADLLGLAAAAATRIVVDRVSERAGPVPEQPVHWVLDAEALRDEPTFAGVGR